MTDRQSLLAAVLANHADDAPRLIYADWLEENGETERAEFIRAQIDSNAYRIARILGDNGSADWATFGIGNKHDWCWSGSITIGDPVEVATRGGTKLVWSRGFVAEVHCTERQWMGGECERCNGRNSATYFRGRPCPNCHGTGRIVGIGPRLVREHPIERVVVTDRQPGHGRVWVTQMPALEVSEWYWRMELEHHNEYDIPLSVWELLQGGRKPPNWKERGGHGWLHSYRTEQAARDAASAAYIEWAKRQCT